LRFALNYYFRDNVNEMGTEKKETSESADEKEEREIKEQTALEEKKRDTTRPTNSRTVFKPGSLETFDAAAPSCFISLMGVGYGGGIALETSCDLHDLAYLALRMQIERDIDGDLEPYAEGEPLVGEVVSGDDDVASLSAVPGDYSEEILKASSEALARFPYPFMKMPTRRVESDDEYEEEGEEGEGEGEGESEGARGTTEQELDEWGQVWTKERRDRHAKETYGEIHRKIDTFS
jgi:hypothetical protein